MSDKKELERVRVIFLIIKFLCRMVAVFFLVVCFMGLYYLYQISLLNSKDFIELSDGLANSCKSLIAPMFVCAFLGEVASHFQRKSETYLKQK